MVISALTEKIKTSLKSVGIAEYEFESRCIIEDILGLDPVHTIMCIDKECPPEKEKAVRLLLEKRISGQPLQYLLGEWEFYGYKFKVGEGVLIPRPDTETLVETVIEHFKKANIQNQRIVDLCSGSGCIAVTLKKQMPSCKMYAVELSSDAMPYLTENIRRNNAAVTVLKGDITDGRLLENFCDPESAGDFLKLDCIVSNPPYLTADEMSSLQKEVSFEPEMALAGGTDGLKFYKIISCLWKEVLADGGLIAFEIGCEQGEAVCRILSDNGFTDIKITKDLAGLDRVVSGIKS